MAPCDPPVGGHAALKAAPLDLPASVALTETDSEPRQRGMSRILRVGMRAEPQLRDLAERIAGDLAADLARRFPDIEWRVELGEGAAKDPRARIVELVRGARDELLERSWDLIICLTDIPLLSEGRPLTAYANATDGAALISVPALGAIDVEDRVREAALDLIEALVGVDEENDEDRRERVHERLEELASPIGTAQVREDDTIRFSNAVIRGNLRLLVGMVRANHPWRVAVKLSRAVIAALGTATYVLASTGFWTLAHHMTWPRLLGLTIAALVITSTALIVAHGLWEHSSTPHTRERVVLFNTVTTLTIAIGVATLYLALLAFSVIGAFQPHPGRRVPGSDRPRRRHHRLSPPRVAGHVARDARGRAGLPGRERPRRPRGRVRPSALRQRARASRPRRLIDGAGGRSRGRVL
jgi:uncharacterized membrane protein